MSIQFFTHDTDDVIGGFVVAGATTYKYGQTPRRVTHSAKVYQFPSRKIISQMGDN